MSSRQLSTKFTLPSDNVEYLEFNASDGNPANWPANTTRVLDSDRHVNYMQHLELDNPTAAKWRVSVGKSIAMDMKLPEGKTYIMRDWPTGYRMFDHHKGPAKNPRHDVYLFGPTSIRFRSINEFIPHAIWLMRDAKDKTTCFCKYCSKNKSQKEITASMGALAATPYQASSSSRANRERKLREPFLRRHGKAGQDHSIYAAVQRIPKPVEALKTSANITTKYAMLVERNADLRAMYTKSGMDEEDSAIGQRGVMKMRRWYRERELVWCALSPPIVDEETSVAIKFWPGIVDEIKLHSEGVPKTTATPEDSSEKGKTPDVSNTSQTLAPSGSVMELDGHAHPIGAQPYQSADQTLEPALPPEPPLLPTPEPVPWSIRQHITYRVQLLAISHWCDALDDQVLPYQAYVPPAELIQVMQSVPATKLEFEREILERFNPCPALGPGDSGPVSATGANLTSLVDGDISTSAASAAAGPPTKSAAFEDAIAPFAMAVQIGSQISEYWSLTDDWEFEYKITRPLGAGGKTHGGNAGQPLQPQPQQAQVSPSSNAQAGPSSTPTTSSSTNKAGSSASSGPLSLQLVLEAAAQHNAGLAAGKMKASSSAPASVASSTPVPSSSNQLNPSASTPNLNGDADRSNAIQVVEERIIQTRFQGLWWGAERIWTDEMIRLKVPRRCLAPKGAQNISAPAGPGKRARENWEKMGRDSMELGAGTRGVFMKLDGLFIVDVKDGDEGGMRKECRACGVLYELVDDDWEDPSRDQQDQQQQQQGPSLPPPPVQPSQPEQQMNSGSGPFEREGSLLPNTQLSTPSLPVNPTTNGEASSSTSTMPYPLPLAPSGYKFRAILPLGFEAIVSLSLISGRYYPRILSHPLMRDTLEQALGNSLENGGLMVYNNLWALEGLAAGLYNSVDPTVYKATREKMVADADKEARGLLEVHRTEKLRGEGHGESVSESGGQGSTDVPMMKEVVMNGTADIHTQSGSVDELAAMDVDS